MVKDNRKTIYTFSSLILFHPDKAADIIEQELEDLSDNLVFLKEIQSTIKQTLNIDVELEQVQTLYKEIKDKEIKMSSFKEIFSALINSCDSLFVYDPTTKSISEKEIGNDKSE